MRSIEKEKGRNKMSGAQKKMMQIGEIIIAWLGMDDIKFLL